MVLNLQLNSVKCFTKEACQSNPSLGLSLPYCQESQLQTLFPIVSDLLAHFVKLPQPLLVFNSINWSAAKSVIAENLSDLSIKALQNYDQELLFGRLVIDNNEKSEWVEGLLSKQTVDALVLHISPLLSNPKLWFLLKTLLLTNSISVRSALNAERFKGKLAEQHLISKTKIILVSNRSQLDELMQLDPEFTQVSSLFIELPNDVIATDSNIQHLKSFCISLIEKKDLKPLSDDAFITLFTFLSSECEHQKRLLFSPQAIEDLIRYAQIFSGGCTEINSEHIASVIHTQNEAQSQARKFSEQALIEKQINLALSGEMIGQINGLSVVELIGSPTEFGEVFRVSASDMIGDGEIIDVERKVELAGNIHAKSTMIVQGYLNHFFTHIANFPFSCNIVFEQSYQESDGDSASLAVLLAATSCYAQLPIKQDLFVTGALDQHGNVLAIGGINHKIKSVTRLFQLGLLNTPVSILMPKANQINLVLECDTLKLIEDKRLNIFGIEHCHQAFPLAMDLSFKETIELINKRIILLQKDDERQDIHNKPSLFNFFR